MEHVQKSRLHEQEPAHSRYFPLKAAGSGPLLGPVPGRDAGRFD
jgi:hypothetical protein